MTGKSGIIPARIREARISRGYSLQTLSDEIGVSSQAISQYELGSIKPQPDVLMRLMNTLNFPLNFFKKPKNLDNNCSNSAIYFRCMKSTPKKFKEAYSCRVGWVHEIYKYIEKYVDFPKVNLPDFSRYFKEDICLEDIESIAVELRKHWNVNEVPINKLSELLEENGFVIAHIKYSSKKVDAFSQWYGNTPYIFLGSETTACRWRFDLAHELGHLILHQNISQEDLNKKEVLEKIEYEANYFAGAFLLPAKNFSKELISISINYFALLKEKWKVSITAMIKRAQHLNLLTDNQARYLFAKISEKGYKKKEPLDDKIPFEKPYLIKQSIELLIKNKILTTDYLLDVLAYNKVELDELFFLPTELLERKDCLKLKIKKDCC